MTLKIVLKTGNYCIESAAKRKFKGLMDRSFTESGKNQRLEKELELLSDFIGSADFSRLRASDERLDGQREGYVVLERDENGSVSMRVSDLPPYRQE